MDTLKLRFLLLVILLISFIPLKAEVYENPATLPDPMKESVPGYVCNPDGLLKPEQVDELNAKLRQLQQTGTVQMAVAVVNSIGDEDPVQFAVDLGTLWGVGQSSNSNGVVLLVAMESHDIALQAGYGAEGVLTDYVCSNIIQQHMIPLMRQDNLYGAVEAAIARVTAIMTDPAVAEEMRGYDERMQQKAKENRELLENLIMLFCVVVFIFTASYYVVVSRGSRRVKHDWYQRSLIWRKSLWPMFIGGVLSAGMGLLFYFMALWRYRYWRTRKRICHKCGGKMHRLKEAEDNAYLNSAQDTEEQLGTVDYDVWLCDSCGEVERYPFVQQQDKYTACPKCGTIAYGTEYERVKIAPTTRSKGIGERVKVCKHCGYTDTEDFDIPRREGGSAAGALAAGAALGALSSRGGGSFGGGGGWGGGSFGGGGASGKW